MYCCLSSRAFAPQDTRQAKNIRLWARRLFQACSCTFLSSICRQELLPSNSMFLLVSLPHDWRLKDMQHDPCSCTVNRHKTCKWKKKRYFFYHLFIKFGLWALWAICCTPSPISALLCVLFCFCFLFVFLGLYVLRGDEFGSR